MLTKCVPNYGIKRLTLQLDFIPLDLYFDIPYYSLLRAVANNQKCIQTNPILIFVDKQFLISISL